MVDISLAQGFYLFPSPKSIGQTGYLDGTEIDTGYFIVLTFLFPQWIALKVIDLFKAEQAHRECALGDFGSKSCSISPRYNIYQIIPITGCFCIFIWKEREIYFYNSVPSIIYNICTISII